LRVTPNHTLWSGDGWVSAGDLKVGDVLGNGGSNNFEIFSIERVYERVPTYNLEVDEQHNYIIGVEKDGGLLVHNDFNNVGTAVAGSIKRQSPSGGGPPGGGPPGGGPCFLAGTRVLMADGSYMAIEDVEVGMLVRALDIESGVRVDRPVTFVFHHGPEEMTDFYLVINDELRVTPNHPLWSGDGWVSAGDLKVGDVLGNGGSNNFEIFSIERVYERVPTYNLEVDEQHNYIIGVEKDGELLVHNKLNEPAGKQFDFFDPSNTGGGDSNSGGGMYYLFPVGLKGFNYEMPFLFGSSITSFTFGGIEYGTLSKYAYVDYYNGQPYISKIEYCAPNAIYGTIDSDKIRVLQEGRVDKNKVLESLGLEDENLDINILIKTFDGQVLLNYGDSNAGDVVSSYTRNVVVHNSDGKKEAEMTINVCN